MARFILDKPPEDPERLLTVELKQSQNNRDVLLLVNGVEVAWLNGRDGELCLRRLDDPESAVAGVAVQGGRIKIWTSDL